MRNFTNPLDSIRIASPCPANWDEMFGGERKRHCGECKLNVYNLSNMTRREAEDLLINSEGRLCVRFFRRADGTILTKNCPVGWQAAKQRVSRVATAAFSMAAGLFGGISAFSAFREVSRAEVGEIAIPNTGIAPSEIEPMTGQIDMDIDPGIYSNGSMTMGKPMIVVKPNTALKLKPKTK